MIKGLLRRFLRQFHLLCALCFGLFLFASALTGSILSWRHELDASLNPDLFHVAAAPASCNSKHCEHAQQAALIDWLNSQPGYQRPSMLSFPENPERAVIAWYKLPAPANTGWQLARSRQVMIDPLRRQILGERVWGDIGFSRALIIPTLFHVHRYFLMGDIGKTLMAVTGLVLLLSCLQGLLLWLPAASRQAWKKSITVHWRGSLPALLYSLHRSAGALLALLLMMLGLTGIYFNQPGWLSPVFPAQVRKLPDAAPAATTTQALPLTALLAIAQQAFPDARISRISLPASAGKPLEIRLHQAGELRKEDGATRISLDPYSGAIRQMIDPLKMQGSERWVSWFYPLHSGEIGGTAGRILISLCGLGLLLLMFSGYVMWWKKRRIS
ncbi:PepSY-associated TM helix domain-containing protein [Undibacterium curvum]|uniref:PepSY-associated TM helix domain-containing protein n=1 Tax=Undibacterium curvum TaxID=2762294 RepID=UPI0022A837ED|nr:PepSY domain-containing protein [Undibacterium curvum]